MKEITSFLLNDKPDSNGFSMEWGAIVENASSWIGKPGILFTVCDANKCWNDHTGGRSLQEAEELSEAHEVTEIVDVQLDESTHTAYAVQRVTSSDFLSKVCSGEVSYVSQSVWLDEPPENPRRIHVKSGDGYTPVHLAYVSDPAYGPDARITDKSACNNPFIVSSALRTMDDEKTSEKKPEEKQAMSMEEMATMIQSMAAEQHETHEWVKSMMDHKAESMDKPDESKKVDSSKPRYNFLWPGEQKPESKLLCDLVS